MKKLTEIRLYDTNKSFIVELTNEIHETHRFAKIGILMEICK